ncbi:serine/threonine-protein kinase [Actinocorallia longicatena]|uniref:non-specific serine/threonine protein kinase n=1 Tax=Actinocorallia longicatena TaxID=111803 RepID=A0ABP6QEF6_9ACTN
MGRLGAGGQGAVYLGRKAGGDWVAIKFLHAQMNTDPQARARFVREVAAAKKVKPFCTASIIEADVDSDRPYVVSEFIDGPSLHDLVAQQGPRPEQELRHLAIGMLTALAAIHEVGIVHRDFKPNNVLLDPDGGPRVVDFGIARTVNSQESAVTATGMVVGTPGYLAPEQLTGAPLQPGVDIFAFAATMVFAATGQSPFEADTLPVIINRILNDEPDLSGIPASLRPVISRCLNKDAAQRPAALEALMDLVPELRGAGGQQASTDEVLNQGTRIASQLPTPPPPRTPTPQPFAPPAQPYAASQGAQPYASQQASPQFAPPQQQPPMTPPPQQQPNFQQPQNPPAYHPQGTPPPFQPGQQGTPPPFQQSGFQQPGIQPPQYPQTPPPFQQGTPPPFQQTPPPFQGTPGPFQQGGVPFQGGPGGIPPHQPPRSGNNAVYAIGCSVLAILAVVLVIVIVAAQGDGKKDPTYSPPPVASASTDPQPTETPSPETSTVPSGSSFPDNYGGTWKGTVYQKKPKIDSYVVTVNIVAGASTGTIRYENAPGKSAWSCSGTLTFVEIHPSASFMAIVQDQITSKNGANCSGINYDVLFPKSDGTGMYFYIFGSKAGAEVKDVNKDYTAIGELKK